MLYSGSCSAYYQNRPLINIPQGYRSEQLTADEAAASKTADRFNIYTEAVILLRKYSLPEQRQTTERSYLTIPKGETPRDDTANKT